MKLVSEEDIAGHRQAVIKGGLTGLGAASLITAPVFYALHRRSPGFRALPLPMKAFGTVVILIPVMSVAAEKAGERYDREQWTGVGMEEIRYEESKEQARRNELSTWQATKDWAGRNKWSILGCSWAAAMVGSFAIVSRNPFQTFTQKLVQARVYAQGLTIVGVLAMAGLSGMQRVDEDTVRVPHGNEHSWKDILEREGYVVDSKDVQIAHHAAKKIRDTTAAPAPAAA